MEKKFITTLVKFLQDHGIKSILFLALMLFLLNGLIYFYYHNNLLLTDGGYVYPLDDTYIHLSIAKNLAFYNNWGVVYNEFSSTSSSPIYTILLAVFIKIFGDSVSYSLYINIFFGNLIFIISFMFFRKKMTFLFFSLFLFTPVLLYVQILSGMEHTLHIFLIMSTCMLFSKILEDGFKKNKTMYLFLIIIGLLCLARYESMFFVVPVVFFICLYKQYKFALVTLIMAFLPMTIFGFYSIFNGGLFFPNSLLIKTGFRNGIYSITKNFILETYNNLYNNPVLYIPLLLITFIILFDSIQDATILKRFDICILKKMVKKYTLVFIVFINILLHILFAKFGSLFRYEAYIYVLLYLMLSKVMTHFISDLAVLYKFSAKKGIAISFICTILLLSLGLGERLRSAHKVIIQAGKNIYDQQIQMSRFVHDYYNTSNIIANDIGAITYYTNISLFDLVGLGSTSVLKEIIMGGDAIALTRQSAYSQYKIIIIYETWFMQNPKEDCEKLGWMKMAELKIANNVICGSDTASFYISDPTMALEFRNNLLLFKQTIPKDVLLKIF